MNSTMSSMRSIVLVAHNLRSTHNVGSLFRTAEGLGVNQVFLTGHTPHPGVKNDERLPHLREKISKQINKTALGAENNLEWYFSQYIDPVLVELKDKGFILAALEQTDDSLALPGYRPPERIAVIVGREVEGIEPDIIEKCDITIDIPMFGKKESYNVVQAAAMALYHLRFTD